jgi:hypothetical protein
MNCWERLDCGREAGGVNVAELGVCPAYTAGAGEACWLVAGTFCGGTIQGTHAEKETSCMACEHYRSFDMRHRSNMRKQFVQIIK